MVREIHFIGKSKNGPFERLEKGISEEYIALQGKTYTYIDDSASTRTGNGQVQWKIDGNTYRGDPASKMLHNMPRFPKTGDNAGVQLVIVFEGQPEGAINSYKAYRQECNFTPGPHSEETFSGVLKVRRNQICGKAEIATDLNTGLQTCIFTADGRSESSLDRVS